MRLPRAARSAAPLLFSVFLAPAACTPAGSGEVDLSGGVADMAAGGPDLRMRRDMAVATSSVKGKVVDETGAALENVPVLACSKTDCQYGNTVAGGNFLVAKVKLGALLVKVTEAEDGKPRRGEGVQPVNIDKQDVEYDVGTIYSPTMGAGVDFSPVASGPETKDVGDGVKLTLTRGQTEAPLGVDPGIDKPLNIAARLVPEARRPRFDLGGEKLVGAVALMPFGTRSKMKVALSIPVAGVAPGTVVYFRAIDDLEGTLTGTAKGVVSANGTADTDVGEGIEILTWVLVSTK